MNGIKYLFPLDFANIPMPFIMLITHWDMEYRYIFMAFVDDVGTYQRIVGIVVSGITQSIACANS